MNTYRIKGWVTPTTVKHYGGGPKIGQAIPQEPEAYAVDVLAPTAEDAWFMHQRNLEAEQAVLVRRLRPKKLMSMTPDGAITFSHELLAEEKFVLWRTEWLPPRTAKTIEAVAT